MKCEICRRDWLECNHLLADIEEWLRQRTKRIALNAVKKYIREEVKE